MTSTVAQLRRYPVKSMRGEELDCGALTERGLLGDRGYALIDTADGRVVSATNPPKWPRVLDYQARYVVAPRSSGRLPPVTIALGDGTQIRSDDPTVAARLSRTFGRDVTMGQIPPAGPSLEELWPDLDELTPMGEPVVSEPGVSITALPIAIQAPRDTFFDYAPLHLLTTGTLDRLRTLYPNDQFDARRFRPNLLVATEPGVAGFVENAWVGRTVRIGAQIVLKIIDPAPRCVMTTLAQADLPEDPGILRTIARNSTVASATFAPGEIFPACAGVYASVPQGGTARRGDAVRIE